MSNETITPAPSAPDLRALIERLEARSDNPPDREVDIDELRRHIDGLASDIRASLETGTNPRDIITAVRAQLHTAKQADDALQIGARLAAGPGDARAVPVPEQSGRPQDADLSATIDDLARSLRAICRGPTESDADATDTCIRYQRIAAAALRKFGFWEHLPPPLPPLVEADRRAVPVPVPEGWRLVPVEPTREMYTAFWDAESGYGCVRFGDAYAAMLAASPQPPQAPDLPLRRAFDGLKMQSVEAEERDAQPPATPAEEG